LFDIDGTLLHSRDRVHMNAFAEGVRNVAGRAISLEGVSLAGNTDAAILAEACRLAGLSESFFATHSESIFRAMGDFVDRNREDLDPEVLPGVPCALKHLADRDALLGVATGNLESIGWTKLVSAGLRDWFRFGGFSDRFLVRSELVAAAAETARTLLGDPTAEICVVGDTPRDIEAARASGLAVVAVATGRYGFEELAALEPDLCTTTLSDLLQQTAQGE
jgi:phosphoglycolate phosphatase-like HAD superfamily hydrolase